MRSAKLPPCVGAARKIRSRGRRVTTRRTPEALSAPQCGVQRGRARRWRHIRECSARCASDFQMCASRQEASRKRSRIFAETTATLPVHKSRRYFETRPPPTHYSFHLDAAERHVGRVADIYGEKDGAAVKLDRALRDGCFEEQKPCDRICAARPSPAACRGQPTVFVPAIQNARPDWSVDVVEEIAAAG
jgi:hypothetical protein